MENESFGEVVGNTGDAPYENMLARRCGVAANYRDVSHPSLPNYIAATSGDTWGISNDTDPASHPLAVSSIYSQLDAAGLSWREYAEDTPGGCPHTSSGLYLVRHDPVAYYTPIRSQCAGRDLPLPAFASDLTSNSLPAFALVVPNRCHDMHDCPVRSGDAWLASWVPRILASRAFRQGRTAVFLTWDEGEGSDADHVALFVIAPSVRPRTLSRLPFNHYSLLKTTEELLGLGLLGHQDTPSTASMSAPFHLLHS
jgi:phospholipase C